MTFFIKLHVYIALFYIKSYLFDRVDHWCYTLASDNDVHLLAFHMLTVPAGSLSIAPHAKGNLLLVCWGICTYI